MTTTAAPKSFMEKLLDGVEIVGNKVPHPAVLFLVLCGIVIVLSHIFHLLGTSVTYQVVDPATHEVKSATAVVNSLLTTDGIRFLISSTVANFQGFGPVSIILVAMLGVGLAEEAGLIKALIRQIVKIAPHWAITFIVVFLGILSSIASDAGYLVLIPLGAIAFYSLGRNPLAGLAAAFSGVAAVFGVNLIITPLDAVLTEVTNDAIHLIDPSKSLYLTANLYFAIVTTFVMCIVCTIITERFVEPRLGKYQGPGSTEEGEDASTGDESRGLRFALYGLIAFLIVLALLTLPPGAALRNPETGGLVGDSPFMNSLIVLVMAVFLVTGSAYAAGARTMNGVVDGIQAIEKTFKGLGPLLFLFLIISQFLAYFNYTNMATVAAVKLGDALEHAPFGAIWLLVGFVVVTAIINVIIPGAIPKWAILAPIFIPLFLKLNIAPEAVLAAYRTGDSPGNVVTPLMGYFGLIVVFFQRWDKTSGVGTVVATMLPYTIVLYVVWTTVLVAWYLLKLPFGP